MNYQESKISILTHLSRSGSTYLASLLDEYDDICVTTEGELPLELFGVKSYSPPVFHSKQDLILYVNNVLGRTRVSSWNIPIDLILKISTQYGFPISGPKLVTIMLNAYKEMYKPKAKLVIYKACPFMPWHISESMQHFPEVSYLQIIRDPRAVFRSQKKSVDPFTDKPYTTSFIITALEWNKAVNISNNDDSIIKFIKYENLLENTQNVLLDIVRFLGVSTKKKSENVPIFSERMVKEDRKLHSEIDNKPDHKKIYKWKKELSNKEIRTLDYCLNESLSKHGYEVIYPHDRISHFHIFFINLREKLQISLLFLKRIKRITVRFMFHPKYLIHQIKLKLNG